jgi:hypothetical protein
MLKSSLQLLSEKSLAPINTRIYGITIEMRGKRTHVRYIDKFWKEQFYLLGYNAVYSAES